MSLRTKVERAFATVVSQIEGFPTDTVNVYKGADFSTHQVPCVVCWCKGGPEQPQGSGNRTMAVTIIVKANAIQDRKGDGSDLDPLAGLEGLSDLVFDGLKQDDLADRLTAAVPDFSVFDPVVDTGFDPDLADVAFLETLSLQIYCCATKLD